MRNSTGTVSTNYRTLIHEESYDTSCKELEENPLLEPAIRGLMWGISKKAEEFDLLPNMNGVRIAKTDSMVTKNGVVPRVVIYFRILDGSNVSLLFIETQDQSDE